MRTLAFYVSGHGFGHASRDIEVINRLLTRGDVRVVVRTTAARWLFDRTVGSVDAPGRAPRTAPFEYQRTEVDTGVVQIDSLHLDAAASLRQARDFMRDFDRRVAAEADVLAAIGATLVVADIPPLGLAAARRAGIPAIALGNFTWDWIYAAYEGGDDVAAAIAAAYADADLALRLPMHGGFEPFRRVVDVPFVARRSARGRDETRHALKLPPDERIVLVSFGGYGLDGIDLGALSRLSGYAVLVSSGAPLAAIPAPVPGGRRGALLPFDEQAMYAAGFRYEDLVRAVDVVVTKPGYGIIAECLANETALLYTSRGHFVEYDVLVEAMPRFLRTRYIAQEELLAGRWQPHLDALLAQPAPPQRPPVDGANVVAGLLADMM